MENQEILACHHRRVVDGFIESVLDEMDLRDVERNVVGVALRREVETVLVPGLTAIQAVFHAADAETLGTALPEWLDGVSSLIPEEAEFLADMGRLVDPAGHYLAVGDLDLRPGESEARKVFEAHLWEMAPCASRGQHPVT